MRIRTIKPEFWTHHELCKLCDFSKLVAIALLNYSDDEGYFDASPMVIRGAVFPLLEDYRSITVALRELYGIGYVELFEIPQSGRLIGRVVNFTNHQVINHASRSKLKAYCDSGNATVILPEDYYQEQGTGKGMERNGTTPQPPKGGGCVVLFEDKYIQFWNQLPKLNRVGSGRTKEAWNKAIRNGAAPQDIIEGVEKMVRYERLRKQQDPNGYRPLHPSTWLNQERWDDGEEFESDQQPANP